jgi:trans-feruloyl-CoA hydratase/vanillin synthase
MARKKEPWGKTVLVDFDDGIAWVTLNRPDKRNAMSPSLNEEMRETVEALADDERCGVFVLTGAGDSFAAGMDLKEYFRETDGKPDKILKVRRTAEEWQWRRLRDSARPTLAWVKGWCFGVAFRTIVACALAIAADEATFGLSEVNWGIIPAGNVTKATSETIGLRNALFYAMTGEPFQGKRAADMGLVNESVPRKKLKKRTTEVARTLLTKNQAVLRGIKIAMKRMRYMDWDASADYLYAKMGEALFFGASDNRANAMKAFLDDKTFKPGLEHFKKTK